MIGIVTLLFFLFSAAEVQSQYIDRLDLTAGDKIISEAKILWGGDGGSTRPIVSVSLKLDKKRYVLGEEYIYEISVKNISGKEIRIPWDTDGDKVNNGNISYSMEDLPAGFTRVLTSIEVRNNTLMVTPVLEVVGLHGSDAFILSIKTMKPEESVMIRATGRWNIDNLIKKEFDEATVSSSIFLELYAVWNFLNGNDFIAYKQWTPSPPIEIELEIPPNE